MGEPTELWPRYVLDDELAGNLVGIREVLRSCEEQAEQERRLPAAAVDALKRLDLFAIASPRSVGGWEASPLLEMEVFESVARCSGAAGWNLFVGAVHSSFPAAYLGDNAIAELYLDGEKPVVAGQMQPVGEGREVDGGMRVTGHYSWGSGISHASHVLGGVVATGADGSPVPGIRIFVVPKAQVEVLDNWHVLGVSGSGSYDYALDDVFVPEGWWFNYLAPVGRRGGAKYGAPIQAQIGSAHIGFALGVGERALEELASIAVAKQRTGARGSIADSEAFQRQLGRAYLELSAARDRGAAVLRRLGAVQAAADQPGAAESERAALLDHRLVAEIRGTASYVTEVARDVAGTAMRFAGGTAVRLDHPIQRVMRELLVAQAHMYVADGNYATLGQAILAETEPAKPAGSFAAPPPLPAG